MNTKIVAAAVLASMFFCIGLASAQSYDTQPPVQYGDNATPPGHPVKGPAGPSNWMLYHRSETCCGPVGGHGPIKTELYLQPGLSFPIGGGVYGNALKMGYTIKGGARVHFYDCTATNSWFLDFSISNTWNQEKNQNTLVPLRILAPTGRFHGPEVLNISPTLTGLIGQPILEHRTFQVAVRDLNRTFVNLGAGRVWYLADPQNCKGWHWRVGVDGGGRYGSARANLVNPFDAQGTRSDQVYGAYFGAQADVVIPCGCCAFLYGVRTEYTYTWTDILQSQNNADFQEISVLMNLGVRF